MSSLRVLSPGWDSPDFLLGQDAKAAELESSEGCVAQNIGLPAQTAVCPAPYLLWVRKSIDGTIGSEWPTGSLHCSAGSGLELPYTRQMDAKQRAGMYHTLQICSFSLILIPPHKHFSYIHWLHYHCRSVINKLKGRIVIQFNLGKSLSKKKKKKEKKSDVWGSLPSAVHFDTLDMLLEPS